MREILCLIEERCAQYERHPFIAFLRDSSVSPTARLAYAPFACHFALTFSDFNRYYLRDDRAEYATDELQALLNRHADEDSRHFKWFLQDFKTLGFDVQCHFTDALRFIWSDLGRRTRELGYYMIGVVRDAEPKLRIAIIEAVEAMGKVFFESTLVAVRQHARATELIYFGQHHFDREQGHAVGASHEQIAAIELSPELRATAVPIVHGIFDRMEAFNLEILERTQAALSRETDSPVDGPPIGDFVRERA